MRTGPILGSNMADTGTTPAADGSSGATGPGGPLVTVRTQYIKDLSFENPGAPRSLADSEKPPNIQVNVDVEAKPFPQSHYEVALHITATAKREETSMFTIELVYAGLFALENIPRDRIENVCLVECPRLLFPFARRIIADGTREGGFPPLLLDPIDFARLLRQHREGAVMPQGAQAAPPTGPAVQGRAGAAPAAKQPLAAVAPKGR